MHIPTPRHTHVDIIKNKCFFERIVLIEQIPWIWYEVLLSGIAEPHSGVRSLQGKRGADTSKWFKSHVNWIPKAIINFL